MPSNYPTPEQLRQETALLQRMAKAGYAGIPTGGNPNYSMIKPERDNPNLSALPPLEQMGFVPQEPQKSFAEQQVDEIRMLNKAPGATGYISQKAPSIIPLSAVIKKDELPGMEDPNAPQHPLSLTPQFVGNKHRSLEAVTSVPFAGGDLTIQGMAGRMFGKYKSEPEYDVKATFTKGFADGGFVDGKSLEEPIGQNTQQQINAMMSNGGLASTARPDLASFAKGGDVDVNDFQPPLQQQHPSAIDVLKNEFAKRGLDFNKFMASPPVMQQALANAQNMGIKGDTMLAHINEKEAKLLKEHGGSGDINPNTGLPMFADDTASSDFFRLYNPPVVNTSYGYGPQQLFYKYLDQKLRSPTTNPTATTNPLTATSTANAVNYQPSTGNGNSESVGAQLAGGPETTQTNTTPGVSNLSSGTMTNIGGIIGSVLGSTVAGPLGAIAGGMLGRSYGIDALSQALGLPSLSDYPSAPVGTPTPSARPGDLESLSSSKANAPSVSAPSVSAPSVSAPNVAETEADVDTSAPAAPSSPSIAATTPGVSTNADIASALAGANVGPGGFGISGAAAAAAAAAAADRAAAADQAATNAANQAAAQNAANNAQTGFGGGIMGGTFGNQGEIGFNADVSGKGQVAGPEAPAPTAPDIAGALSAAAGAMANSNAAVGSNLGSAAQASDFGQGLGSLSGGGFNGPGFSGRDSSTETTGGGFGGPGFGGRDSSTTDTTGTTGGNTTGEVSGGGFSGRDSSTADSSGQTGGNAGGQTGGGFSGPGFGGRDSSTADTTGQTGGNTTAGDTQGGGFGGPGFGGRDSSTADTTGQTGGNTTAGDNASPGENGNGPESASVAKGGFIARSKPRSPLNAVAKKKHAKSPLKAMRKA